MYQVLFILLDCTAIKPVCIIQCRIPRILRNQLAYRVTPGLSALKNLALDEVRHKYCITNTYTCRLPFFLASFLFFIPSFFALSRPRRHLHDRAADHRSADLMNGFHRV